ncbi:MAG TPA: AMP-binding protein [Kofleriaceae bacterium]|nr:AMP-binding protein [Kofleriaceae bacterium]
MTGTRAAAAASTVAGLFAARARVLPRAPAAADDRVSWTYGELCGRVAHLAGLLRARGVAAGDRIAVLSRNRVEYLELFLAAGWIGAVVACQNWRLADGELAACIDLVAPALLVASPEEAPRLAGRREPLLVFGAEHERALAGAAPVAEPVELDPEAPLLILYTSGTTGLPKGAVISHRAEIARNLVLRAEFAIAPADAYAAWSPLYHMGGAEYSLGTLMAGGAVFVVDGFRADRLVELVEREPLGWLLLMPGMVGRFADALEARGARPRGVKVCGVMADLVPPADIARVTRLLGAPYANTFGATETGCPPCSSSLIPIGALPTRLSKEQSPFCEVRLVDEDDREVPDGQPGELCMRGPTLFSGYWAAPEANAADFRGGWFHMGDVFVRNPDGTLDFVDRRKYLIKSGGENIYPAEIERVLLRDPRVAEAAVVRLADPTWGEVPVAFVARTDPGLTGEELAAACRAELASYKKPRAILFIELEDFPRSASGKVLRYELERRLKEKPP